MRNKTTSIEPSGKMSGTASDSRRYFDSEPRFLRRLRLVDFATLAYMALISIFLLVGHARVPGWYYFILAHLVTAAIVLGLIRLTELFPILPLRVLRDIYPMLLYTFFFKEISLIISIFFPFWLEVHLINWDIAIFGDHPAVWLKGFYRPWLTEFMAFSYWSYYLLFPTAWLVWYLRENKDVFHSLMFNLSLTMYTCYTLYLFLTARGPQQTLAFLHAPREAAGFFDSIVLGIQAAASITGAAFPSSHVAAVWVMLIFLFRFSRWLGLAFLPLIVALTISTVYLQYHYAVDALAGILMICFTYPAGVRVERWFNSRRTLPRPEPTNVSL